MSDRKYIAVAEGSYSAYGVKGFYAVPKDFDLDAVVREFAEKAGLVRGAWPRGVTAIDWRERAAVIVALLHERVGLTLDPKLYAYPLDPTDAFRLWFEQRPEAGKIDYEEISVSEDGFNLNVTGLPGVDDGADDEGAAS